MFADFRASDDLAAEDASANLLHDEPRSVAEPLGDAEISQQHDDRSIFQAQFVLIIALCSY